MDMLATNWEQIAVSKLCEAIIDCVNKTAPTVEGPTPFRMIRTTNVKNGWVDTSTVRYVDEQTYQKWIRRGAPRCGDVILTREAPLGEVGLLRDDEGVFLGQRLVMYRANPEKLDNRFLLYSLLSHEVQGQIKSLGSGATVEHMRVPDCENIEIRVPPIQTQRKIATILSTYDDLIENNLRRIKILEEMAQNLYREWFVKFRFPDHQHARFIDSPLGPIPEGWEVSSVRNASSLVSRGPSLKYSDKEGIPVLNQRCVRDGEISLDTIQHAEPLGKNKEHLYLRQYDILINSMGVGTLGRVSRNVSIIEKMIIHNCITVVRPDVSRVSAPQLFYCIKDNQTRFESLGVGATGQTSLRPEVIKETSILLPTEEVSKQFSHFVLPLWDQVGVLKRRNEVLRRTRDLLLPRLISGEVDVSALDIIVPEETEA